MSATPPNFPGTVSATPSAGTARSREIAVHQRRQLRIIYGSDALFAAWTWPQSAGHRQTLHGHLKRAWLDAHGPVTFYFRSLQEAQTRLNFSLFGSWPGQMLLLDDKGNMALSFAADGRAKGYLPGANSPKQDTVCSTKSGNRPFAMRPTYFC